jgi:hypothetical protein
MRGFGILAIALALAGCAGNNQPGRGEIFSSKSEIEAKDDSTCRGYGAKPGDPVYIQSALPGINGATLSSEIELTRRADAVASS